VGQVRKWIAQLDANSFEAREAATRELADHMEAAAGLLREELEVAASPEVRERIEQLLAGAKEKAGETGRIERAVRLLEYADTPAARQHLKTLSEAGADSPLARSAKSALERIVRTRDGR
jgi:hypothetical protein